MEILQLIYCIFIKIYHIKSYVANGRVKLNQLVGYAVRELYG